MPSRRVDMTWTPPTPVDTQIVAAPGPTLQRLGTRCRGCCFSVPTATVGATRGEAFSRLEIRQGILAIWPSNLHHSLHQTPVTSTSCLHFLSFPVCSIELYQRANLALIVLFFFRLESQRS